jgi:hypothetical protein
MDTPVASAGQRAVRVPPLGLRDGDRERLTGWARSSTAQAGLAQRARIVLLARRGRSTTGGSSPRRQGRRRRGWENPSTPAEAHQPTVSVSVSVGVAGAVPTAETVLVKLADAALYAAKVAGRDRVVLAPTEDAHQQDPLRAARCLVADSHPLAG